MLSASDHRERAKKAAAWAVAETDPQLKAYWLEAARCYEDCGDRADVRERLEPL